MKTKVKVKRAELIKIVEGRLRKAENEHKRAVAEHPERLAAWQAEAVAKIEKALEAAKRGKLPSDRYGHYRLDFNGYPVKPSKDARELCQLRRLLKTLQIGTEESILLSQDDADSYFGPCRS